MENKSAFEKILNTLSQKSSMKQDVGERTRQTFDLLKKVAFELVAQVNTDPSHTDKRVVVDYKERGEFEFEMRFSGELIIFAMHTNVFDFDKSHVVRRSSYIKDDPTRSFCGMINIYNFLNDSFKYNRLNDLGYMIGRIFVNKDNHYFLEGKRQLGFLFNDFVHSTIDEASIRSLLESIILHCLEFDLYTPPFDSIREITVSEMQAASESMQITTGKRLGFRFQADDEEIEG